jgi:hypothetical protein
VDSHTHLVFAGDRTAEFEARMAGADYAAGGIAVTTEATRAAGDYELTRLLLGRAAEAAAGGTTYLETKTGYGLDLEHETRSARIAAGVVDEVTYLGAHLVPAGMDADDYTALVAGRCSTPCAPTSAGPTCSASGGPSPRSRAVRCSPPAGTRGWDCGCTATSSGRGRGPRSPWSSGPPASTTPTT